SDRITLTIPEDLIVTNGTTVITNIVRIVVDEVTYGDGGRWGKWADGGGSSLELMDPRSNKGLPSNWADSDESAKAPWTTIETTGVMDNGNGAIDELQMFLQGTGECLVDDVQLIPQGGSDVVANGNFENGLTGWVPQGTHDESSIENVGYNSSRSLHLRATSRGDHGANRIRTPLTSTLNAGGPATIRAKVRWLRGHPELLLRVHGNYLEAVASMTLPRNLGTPGAVNSRAAANAGPAIFNVSHSPVLPNAFESVTVRAQVHDPDGLASLVVNYRVDPDTNYSAAAMVYNGAGFYSAVLPGQPAGGAIAFYIRAADGATQTAFSRFPDDAPARECILRFGEPTANESFPTYRLWMSQRNVDRWASRLKLHNGDVDGTFIANNSRAIYNMGALYSGSPWVSPSYDSPVGGLCGYVLHFAKDDPYLGNTDFVLDWPIRDGTGLLEQVANWMANQLDISFDHRRSINLYVNSNLRGTIYEDAQQPNSDVVEQWFPEDTDGDLFKIDDWIEYDDNANKEFNVDATLQDFVTSGGEKKLARYRWNWRKRATDTPNDYTNFFALVDAVNAPDAIYTQRVEDVVDVEQWMRVFAIEHIVGNWDSYGYNRGKNMYVYKPRNGKWSMLMWDIDFVLGAGSDGPTASIYNVNDATIARMYSHPPFRRAYLRAIEDAVKGPLMDTKVNPIIDERYNAFVAAGLGVSDPSPNKDWIQQRRNYLIANELAPVASSFTVSGPTSFSTSQNLITLSGNAPISVKTILINGVAANVTWNSVTSWTLRVALSPGNNALNIQGVDPKGVVVGGATASLQVNYTGTVEQPQDKLVINEIMYQPANPDAEFVEIHNTSTANAFDLSNWRISGIDCTIPAGTIAGPGSFLVFARDRAAFAATYGSSIPVAGEYNGRLSDLGDSLKLIKPGAASAQDQVIDHVTYESVPPWPAAAAGTGSSLQLIDPMQDNDRVANWAVVVTNAPPPAPQWQYVTATGNGSSASLYVYLNTAGDVYIDDMKLVEGTIPEVGANLIANG
ncbi:MAG TPA: CotH kinase family protein, partial [Clostridia bacterium]|nr:CotH kinase family protein [Clostridia bacterium]